MINIIIPKGCNCKNIEVGSYGNQVELQTPKFLLQKKIGCYTFRETICVDKCLKDLILELWKHGVTTTGSCCGHNKVDGYIGIK